MSPYPSRLLLPVRVGPTALMMANGAVTQGRSPSKSPVHFNLRTFKVSSDLHQSPIGLNLGYRSSIKVAASGRPSTRARLNGGAERPSRCATGANRNHHGRCKNDSFS